VNAAGSVNSGPFILARLKTSRSVRKLSVLPLWWEPREEDVGDAKTARRPDLVERWSSKNLGSALERGFTAVGKAYRGRASGDVRQ